MQDACFGGKWKVMLWLASRRNASRVAIEARMPDLPFSPRSAVIPHCSATKRTTPSERVGVEVVAHHVPRRRWPGGGEQAFQERHVVRLGAAVANAAEDLAGGDIDRRDQTLGT